MAGVGGVILGVVSGGSDVKVMYGLEVKSFGFPFKQHSSLRVDLFSVVTCGPKVFPPAITCC